MSLERTVCTTLKMAIVGLTALQDRSLHGLQVLSAHVKLLLDAPEHLWRLIEKRRYLHAAWLFLLARVTHRSLARKDDEDQPWAADGVDITVRPQYARVTVK